MDGLASYKLVATFECENAITKVYRPDLDPDEYEKRFKRLYAATEAILREVYWPKKSTNK